MCSELPCVPGLVDRLLTHKESIPGVCLDWAMSGVETGDELRGRRVPSAAALVLFRVASRWAQPWAGLLSPGGVWRQGRLG